MRLLSIIGFGTFVLASLSVGLRLLLLARRTRQVPELSIGLALFLGGGVGYLLIMLVLGVRVITGPAASVVFFAGSAGTALGAACLAIGVRRIYRPADRVASRFVTGASLVLATTLVGRLLDLDRIPAAPWIFWTATLVSGATYLWSAWESFHYHQLMRRRVRIGLAEPLAAQRFLLWGVSASAAVGMHVASMISRALDGSATPPEWLMGTTSLLGLVAAAGLWLAFFPRRSASPRPAPTR